MKKRLFCLLLTILFLFMGCSANNYSKLKKEFYETYFSVIENIDTTGKDIDKIKEVLLSEENNKKIDKLKDLLIECEEYSNSDTKKEKELGFNTKKKMYEDLVFLKNAFERFDQLSHNEKGEIDLILITMGMDLDDWKDKRSSRRWP